MKTLAGIFVFLFLTSLPAQADIIFIDFHNSAGEVKAAREAAEARGEKLIVLTARLKTTPDWMKQGEIEKQREIDSKKAAEMTVLMSKFKSPSAKGYSTAKRLRDDYQAKVNAANRFLVDVEDRTSLDTDDLDRALSKMESEHRTLTSIVISGHSDGEATWGEAGTIQRQDLLGVFNKHPSQKATLDSVLLWGCHSAHVADVLWWNRNFPEVDMIAGFAGAAPLAATAASPGLLKQLLIKQANIEKQGDEKKLKKVFTGLKDVNATYLSLSTNGCYVANVEHEGIIAKDLTKDKNEECAKVEPAITGQGKVFAQYFKARKEDYNLTMVLANPHNDLSPLRLFYNSIQNYGYCPGLLARLQLTMGMKVNPSIVLGLIFFHNVQDNFEAYYGVKMGSSRPEVLNKISSAAFKNDKNHQAAVKLLQDLNCVPASWMTEDPQGKPDAPDSACLSQR